MKLKHYLFASEYNDYKPWIITPPALAIFCLVIWAFRFLMPGVTIAAGAIDADDLMSRINSERTQRFIPALIKNSKLVTAASGKANDMMSRSYFAHQDPDGNYVWPRIEAAGYKPYTTLGENLAMGYTSASDMISAWMNSPGHRDNIVNAKFEDQGLASIFGTFEPGNDTNIAVSIFGALYKTTPAPQPPPYNTPPYSTPLYFTPNPPPAPYSTPLYRTPAAPPAAPSPVPAPVPLPAPAPPPATASTLAIYNDVKITTTSLSDKILVNIDVVIAGSPTLVTATLKSQSITLVAGKTVGQFLGSFTFDIGEEFADQVLTVEARDKTGTKKTQSFPVNIEKAEGSGAASNVEIPVSNEAQVISILRVIFGIFAALYLAFLIADAFIIHRAKVKRAGIHSSPHILVIFLIAVVTLFASLF